MTDLPILTGEMAQWVMVVDDDEDIRAVVVEVLQGAGYGALAAPGAIAALRRMRERVPTLVLADLTMIDMDGRAFLTCARELLGSSTPPFVFLTGVEPSRRSDVTEAVLAKPFAIDDLLSIVKQHFRA
jgi:CheY-like chemotaxis protein